MISEKKTPEIRHMLLTQPVADLSASNNAAWWSHRGRLSLWKEWRLCYFERHDDNNKRNLKPSMRIIILLQLLNEKYLVASQKINHSNYT
ncbi:hypothetical protein CEXT_647411 [Caerostris extrusa]|uniref:Ycf15 n=1 Tax=Caerostris extrusa TaxID=172846 RepID=A0AAV4NQ33_CAEEX|nr:hypothetical protein CEXT_647411 [Caerostris extrusa]